MFQRYVNKVFYNLILVKVVVVYMDDIIVTSESETDNLMKLKRVFEVAEKAGHIIRFDKCQFVQTIVSFIGHILEAGIVRPSEEKTNAIRKCPTPKNVKQVQSFLGLAKV